MSSADIDIIDGSEERQPTEASLWLIYSLYSTKESVMEKAQSFHSVPSAAWD